MSEWALDLFQFGWVRSTVGTENHECWWFLCFLWTDNWMGLIPKVAEEVEGGRGRTGGNGGRWQRRGRSFLEIPAMPIFTSSFIWSLVGVQNDVLFMKMVWMSWAPLTHLWNRRWNPHLKAVSVVIGDRSGRWSQPGRADETWWCCRRYFHSLNACFHNVTAIRIQSSASVSFINYCPSGSQECHYDAFAVVQGDFDGNKVAAISWFFGRPS